MTRNLAYTLLAGLVFLVSFTGFAHAADATYTAAEANPLDLLAPVFDAFRHGHHLYAGSLALVLLVAGIRRYGSNWAWVHTNEGSAGLVFAGAFGATMATHLAGGTTPTWGMWWNAACVGGGAIGGYTAIKHMLIVPYLAKWADKGPKWLHQPMKLILWIFDQKAKTKPTTPTAPSP